MFIFIMILTAIFIPAIIINLYLWNKSYSETVIGMGKETSCYISWIVGMILAICLISIPISNVLYSDTIKAYKACQETVNVQRKVINEYEGAILTAKIIEWNANLARWKNQDVWYRLDWWIPDAINELEPIK